MLAPTHIVLGQAAFLMASIATAHVPSYAEALCAAAFSLLPDLDKRQSYIGRALPFISEPLDYHVGHRTLTHSLLLQVCVACLCYRLLPFGWWLALLCGLVSHTLGDMMTPQGVAWFWPSTRRCVLPGNARFRFEPMSTAELGFVVILSVLSFPLVHLAQAGAGTSGLIRHAIGDIARAREEYDAGKGAHAWRLQLRGRDNRRYADIAGEYPVIGPWGEAGFILETSAGPRSVCRSANCDWSAEHTVLLSGAPEQTTTRAIGAKTLVASNLIEQLRSLRQAGAVYLLGTLRARNMRETLPTVIVAGERVMLSYAEPTVLEGLGHTPLRDVDLLVQVRHPPGRVVPELVMTEQPETRLSPLLRRWVE